MKNRFYRQISLLLASLMFATSLPMNAYAAEPGVVADAVTIEGEEEVGGDILINSDGKFYMADEEGKYFLVDEDGNKILDENGDPVEVDETGEIIKSDEPEPEQNPTDEVDSNAEDSEDEEDAEESDENREDLLEDDLQQVDELITAERDSVEWAEFEGAEYTYTLEEAQDNDELVWEYFENEIKAGSGLSADTSTNRHEKMFAEGSWQRKTYNAIRAHAEQIAAGEESSAIVEINIDREWTGGELGRAPFTANNTANDLFGSVQNSILSDWGTTVSAARNDCPYEFYWADLSFGLGISGYSVSTSKAYFSDEKGEYVFNTTGLSIKISIAVVPEYSVTGQKNTYVVNKAKTAAPRDAAANALNIVEEAKSYSDYDKLKYYCDSICALNKYNHEAAGTGNDYYGDPWQIIYLFDNNPSTNVVCEGYSKGFQFLCDNSTFVKNIKCRTVSGDLLEGSDRGKHMWNVVRMDDGKNYLVDVTNCDIESGTIYDLFIANYKRKVANSSTKDAYIFRFGSDIGELGYVYANDTERIYSRDELVISASAYNNKAYNIIFDVNGGDELPEDDRAMGINFNDEIGELPVPHRAGYSFDGWFTDKSGVAQIEEGFLYDLEEDLTLYAHWTMEDYLLTFNFNDSPSNPTIESYNINYGQKYGSVYTPNGGKLPTPTSETAEFVGWFTDPRGGEEITDDTEYLVEGPSTIYAHWLYEISFFMYEGVDEEAVPAAIFITPGDTVGTLPQVTREGYKLLGWFTEKEDGKGSQISENTIPVTGTTYYAHWAPAEYTITFNYNCNNAIKNTTKKIGYMEPYGQLPIPKRAGYTLLRWTESADGITGTIAADASGYSETPYNHKENITLYAQWKKEYYTLTFKYEDGETPDETRKGPYNEKYNFNYLTDRNDLALPTPTRVGYTFAGWYTAVTGGTKVTESTKYTGDATVYARWTPDTVKVTYDTTYNGGAYVSGPKTASLKYGNKYGNFPVLKKDGSFVRYWFYLDAANGNEKVVIDSESLVEYEDNYTTHTLTVYPEWADAYKVTLNTQGGGDEDPVVVAPDDVLIDKLPTPNRVGHIFTGWYTKPGDLEGAKISTEAPNNTLENIASNPLVKEYSALGDITLYAHWAVNDTAPYQVANPIISVVRDEEPVAGMESVIKATDRIAISCDTKGATILYTVDDTVPEIKTDDIDDDEYTTRVYDDELVAAEVAKSGVVTIKAIAVKDNYRSSNFDEVTVAAASYTLLDESGVWGDIKEEDRKQFGDGNGDDPDADKVPANLWVVGVPKSVDYTGKAQTIPEDELRVYYNKTLLENKKDYTVSYKDNINASTEAKPATITITGKGDYTGTIVKTFTINPLDLEESENVSYQSVVYDYNNRVQKGTTTIKYDIKDADDNILNTVTLKANTDYTYVYPDVDEEKDGEKFYAYRSLGPHTIKIVGKGNYTGEFEIEELIVDKSELTLMSKVTVKPIPNQAFTGSKIKVPIVVTYKKDGKNEEVLIPYKYGDTDDDYDYDVEYEQGTNDKLGTATVILTGNPKRGFIGEKRVTFKIVQCEIKDGFVIDDIADKTYTGTAIKFDDEIVVTDSLNGQTLTAGVDYTIAYANNTNAAGPLDAAGKVNKSAPTVKITGKGNYKGTITQKFTIEPYDISNDDITANDILLAYTGNVQKGTTPVVFTKGDGKTVALKNGTDFTFAYPDTDANSYIGTPGVNQDSEYNVNIVGKGNYTGIKVIKEKISTKVLMSKVAIAAIPNQVYYPGKAWEPELTVTYTVGKTKTPLVNGVDYDVTSYVNNTSKGTATVTITGKDGYIGSKSATFKITDFPINKSIFGPEVTKSYEWTGSVIDPINPAGRGDDGAAEASLKYVVNGVTYNLKGFKGTEAEFKTLDSDEQSKYDYIYNYTIPKGKDEATVLTNLGTVTVNFIGVNGYSGKVSKQYKIVGYEMKADREENRITVELDSDSYDYIAGQIKPVPVVKEGDTVLQLNKDYTVSYVNNTNAGIATVKVTGKGNYRGTFTKTFTINPLDISGAAKADIAVAYNGRIQKSVPVLSYVVDNKIVALRNNTDFTAFYPHTNSKTTDPDDAYDKTAFVGETSRDNTYEITVTGKGNYTGTTVVKETVLGKNSPRKLMSGITVKAIPNQIYTGSAIIIPDKDILLGKVTDGYVKGVDYSMDYINNVEVGTASIIFRGIPGGRIIGDKVVTFKIVQYEAKDGNSRLVIDDIADKTYTGAAIKFDDEIVVKDTLGDSDADNDKVLVPGVDYTIAYANNTNAAGPLDAAGKVNKSAPTVKITGKGKYKGTITKQFTILPMDISEVYEDSLPKATLTAADVMWQNKANICKPSIVVTNTKLNKKMALNSEYQVKSYEYVKDTAITQVVNKVNKTIVRPAGAVVDAKDVIPAGTEIKVTVNGVKNYTGELEKIFRFVSGDISKASVTVVQQEYTGKPVKPNKDAITVKVGSVILNKTDYVITGYENNIARGTAKVTIQGIGNYIGSKTATFKIANKSMNYTVIYEANYADVTGKMNKTVTAANAKVASNAFKRNGYTFKGWSAYEGDEDPVSNPVVIKNAGALKLNDVYEYGSVIHLYSQWTPNAYKITYNLMKVGKDMIVENNPLNPSTYTIEDTDVEFDDAITHSEDYEFEGWYLDNRFTPSKKVRYLTDGPLGNKTVYAKWVKVN